MRLMECPWCGFRDEVEFRFGGSFDPEVEPPAGISAAALALEPAEAIPQVRMLRHERWSHTAGCRRWFNVVRDVSAGEIMAIYPMGVAAPDVATFVPLPPRTGDDEDTSDVISEASRDTSRRIGRPIGQFRDEAPG